MAKIISAFVMKLENSLAILIHALRRIRLMLNFSLQRKPFMKCQQALRIRKDNLFDSSHRVILIHLIQEHEWHGAFRQ